MIAWARRRLSTTRAGHRGERRSPPTGHCAYAILARHHGASSSIRRPKPRRGIACYGRDQPVNDSHGHRTSPANRSLRLRHPGASSWRFIIDPSNPTSGEASLLWTRPSCQRLGRHRPSPATGHYAYAILARHHGASSSIRRTPPQARQGCYGRGHPVNDSDVTDQPATVLTVVMARHHRSVEPHPRRGKLAMEATTLSTTRTSPNITGHRAGGRRGASSAFAEPLTVHSLASAATLSTAPTGTPRGITSDAA